MSKLILKNVRLSFPSLWSTEIYNGEDTEKFAATLLIPKEEKQVAKIKQVMKEAAEEKFGKSLPKSLKWCLSDGDEKEYDGYAGHYTIKATTKKRPTVVDSGKTPLIEDDNKIYAGCFVNASINIWVMDNQYGKRVLANLNGIQFVKDGPKFGSDNNALDDFDVLENDDDDVDPFGDSDIPF